MDVMDPPFLAVICFQTDVLPGNQCKVKGIIRQSTAPLSVKKKKKKISGLSASC